VPAVPPGVSKWPVTVKYDAITIPKEGYLSYEKLLSVLPEENFKMSDSLVK
jgi:hypothetical protein